MPSINRVVIVGSGPIGSFMAVLIARLGIPVTVYEKRQEFTREINLKIESGFFEKVKQILDRLEMDSEFFKEINDSLRGSGDKIVIKNLEKILKEEALLTGNVEYKTEEVKSFEEIHKKHGDENPIILDCTGSNSKLRVNAFGDDEDNMVTIPLQHAMYINFKAKNVKPTALYQVIKNIGDIKLADIVASKRKDENNFTSVTIPVFISDELAREFNDNYPNINQKPLNPFLSSNQVPDKILHPISSIISTLMLKGWEIDLSSITVKKIEINCGYAERRSNDRCICLGDSAVQLAYFRSLNLGLEHALKFFVKLSSYCEKTDEQGFCSEDIIKQFKRDNPYLNPVAARKANGRNSYLIVTKVRRYGCFHYCLTTRKTEKLTGFFGIGQTQIDSELGKLNNRLDDWKAVLQKFESERYRDIKNEIKGNKRKNALYNFVSRLIDKFTGHSAAFSESVKEKVYIRRLYLKNYEFFRKCFRILEEGSILDTSIDKQKIIDFVVNLLNEYKQPRKEIESKTLLGKVRNFFLKHIKKAKEFIINIFSNSAVRRDNLLNQLTKICEDNTLSTEDKINSIKKFIEKREPFIKRDVELSFIISLISNTIKQSGTENMAVPDEGQTSELVATISPNRTGPTTVVENSKTSPKIDVILLGRY